MATFEMVMMMAAIASLMVVTARFTRIFMTSTKTLIKAEQEVRSKLTGIPTPCLENYAAEGLDGGRSKNVVFMTEKICN